MVGQDENHPIGEVSFLKACLRFMEEQLIRVQETIVIQGKAIEDLTGKLNFIVKIGLAPGYGVKSHTMAPHATPMSGPPPTVHLEEQHTEQTPARKRSARLRKSSNNIQMGPDEIYDSHTMAPDATPISGPPQSVDLQEEQTEQTPSTTTSRRRRKTSIKSGISTDEIYDTTYTPRDTMPLSTDEDEQAFRRRKNKKARKATNGQRNKRIQKGLFSLADKGGAKSKPDDIIFTHVPRPYGLHFVNLLDISPRAKGDELPKWMLVEFRAGKDMEFIGPELAVSAYIFGSAMDRRELLVHNMHCCGDRNAFMTIVPGQPLVDDVLIMVAAMLTHGSIGHKWYLPTTFTQIALHENPMTGGTLAAIRRDFMGNLDKVIKIYVPMHKDNHWFLMVIDLLKEELVYLDSMKSDNHKGARIHDMIKVASFMQKMFDDDSFYIDPTQPRPLVSTFTIVEPPVPQQDPASNDCGVWVAQWMMLSPLWSRYDFGVVNDTTRMRLAIDLALKPYNPNREVIKKKAIQSWNSHQFGPDYRR